MLSVVRSDWFETATERIEAVFDDASYVVDVDLQTYILTPLGWQAFGVLGSPDFYCQIGDWDRWNMITAREKERQASSPPNQVMDNEHSSPFTDINGLVADLLEDVAKRPIPRVSETRLAEIRQAVAEGNATVDMALEITYIFPNKKGT